VRFGGLLAVNAIILVLSCVFLSMALFYPGKEGISIPLTLIAVSLAYIPLSAVCIWWGLMFIRWSYPAVVMSAAEYRTSQPCKFSDLQIL
jgi:hypothetical protein